MAKNLTRQGGCLKYKDTVSGFVKYIVLKNVRIEKISGNTVRLSDGSVYDYTEIDSPSVASAEALADEIGTFIGEAQAGAGGGGSDSTVYSFFKGGAVTANTLIGPQNGIFSATMGIPVLKSGTITDVWFRTGDTSAAATETLTVGIRAVSSGFGTTGSGTQYTTSSGSQVVTVDLASGGALGNAFYRGASNTGLSASVTAGDDLLCTISNFGFWTVSDIEIFVKIEA